MTKLVFASTCPACGDLADSFADVSCPSCGYGPLRPLSPAEELDWALRKRTPRVTA